MKICLGSDHRGYKLKEIMKVYLQEKGYEIIDVGTKNFDRVDFPDYCFSLCQKVVNKDAEIGILFCGTGIGMSIAANKVKGIYCARITNVKEAKLAKEHNDANVIALSGNICPFKAKKMVMEFLKEKPLDDPVYSERIEKIKQYEEK